MQDFGRTSVGLTQNTVPSVSMTIEERQAWYLPKVPSRSRQEQTAFVGMPGAIDRVHRMMDSGALGYVQELPLAPVGKHESGAWMWL